MTSSEERQEEFFEECVPEDPEEADYPGAKKLDTPQQEQNAQRYRNMVKFHRKAAKDHLDGEAKLMAIKAGYYMMLHKTNEAVVYAGFDPNTHLCSMFGLRGFYDTGELASELDEAKRRREEVDYHMNPSETGFDEAERAEDFIENTVEPFIDEVEELIDESGYRS